jgi:hypothetical protein
LVPSSEGGAVTPAHLGEGFAGGGSPALPNATDMAALLSAQAQMFGPFSQGGLYGGEQGGLPGGGSGRVPAANLPVGHLAVAGELPKQTSALEQANQIADLADKASGGIDWAKRQIGSSDSSSGVNPSLANYAGEKMGESIANTNAKTLEDVNNFMPSLYRGGVAGGRNHYADGGMPYSQQTGPGLTIPDEQKEAPKLMTASNAPGQSQSGLGQIAGIAKDIGSIVSLASMFSDKRLKENIKKIGKTYDGQNIYSYNYKGDPRQQIGLLAQDVEKHHPHAVGLAHGYKTVDYDKATERAANRGHFYSGGVAGGRHGYATDGTVDPDSIPVPDNQIAMIGDEDINNQWARAARHADNAPPYRLVMPEMPKAQVPQFDIAPDAGQNAVNLSKDNSTSSSILPGIVKGTARFSNAILDAITGSPGTFVNTGDISSNKDNDNLPVLMPQSGPVRVRPSQTGLVAPDAKRFIGPNQPNQLPDPAIVGPTDTAGLAGASPTSSAPPAGLAAAPAPTSPVTRAGLAGAAPVAADTKDEKQPDFLDRIAPKGGFLDRMTETRNLIPLLSGIAAMGTAPTRSFGVALASGLGAGAKSYLGTQTQQAEIGRTQAQTGLDQSQAVMSYLQKYQIPGVPVEDPNGKLIINGRRYSILPMSAVRQGAAVPHPNIDGQQYHYITPEGASASISSHDTLLNSPAFDSSFKDTNNYINDTSQNALTAKNNLYNTRQYASSLSNLPQRTQGDLGQIESSFKGWWNSLFPDSPIEGLSDQQIVQKSGTLLAAMRAKEGNERAAQALEAFMSATPNARMMPEARNKLMAAMMVAEQQKIDQNNYLNEFMGNIEHANPGEGRYFMASDAKNAFGKDYNANKYSAEEKALSYMLSSKNEKNSQSLYSNIQDIADKAKNSGDPEKIKQAAKTIDALAAHSLGSKMPLAGFHRFFFGDVVGY